MIKVSFIIITRNRKEKLKKCIDSILKAVPREKEIIIIDNNSNDGTLEMLQKYNNIKVFRNDKNIGPVASRNIAMKNTQSDYLFFLDDDIEIKKINLDKIIKYMQQDKRIGIVGPKLFYKDNHLQESARSFPSILTIIWRGTFLHKIFPNVNFYARNILNTKSINKPQEVDWVLGASQVIKKQVFNNIGYFDEDYYMYYGEDIDFCYRAKKAKWKILYWPDALIYHYYNRSSYKGIFNRYKWEHIKSILYYFYKIWFKY